MEKITLAERIVTIKEVMIGNIRMTKSFFNQIEMVNCFDQNMDFRGDFYYGYVNEKDGRYLLWVIEGKLRKTHLTPYLNLMSSAEDEIIHRSQWFLKKYRLEYIGSSTLAKLSDELTHPEKYEELVGKAKAFIRGLSEQQVFL